jgi:hypothetical protein
MSIPIIDDIKSSLEYYDSYQPKINELVNKIHYIRFINNKNITDEIIFFDKNKKEIFKSSYEILAAYIPHYHAWKWSWSLPSTEKKKSFISRKILEYAFDLDNKKDYLLKSTLINSKIKIINDLQLDIYKAISASLSKKPFILKIFSIPLTLEEDLEYYPFKKINEDSESIKYVTLYLFILDYEP